jgi:carboxyl-terminal processing protease
MPRLRTAAAATLLVVPIVAGGFLLQEPPARANTALFDQVLQLVSNQYVDTLPGGAVFEKAARGLVRELNDPYSELMSPKASEDFSRGTNGRYGGTGMSIGQQQTIPVVDRVFPNTPAEEAGVREGDRIVAVGATATQGLAIEKVSDMLRGEPGSTVDVTYARPGVAEPIKLHFTRRVIHVPAVAYSMIVGNGIGYVPLQTFNENAAEEVQAAIEKLEMDGAKGLVLDMRDNPGGIVDQSLAVASLFLPDGKDIVSVRTRTATPEVARSSGKHLATQIPLVVLVDGQSASAAEIVAGALQDHDRALVLGTTTFGKGLVQSLYRLNGGYNLKMTTGKWFTPSGRSIHRERRLLPDGRYVEVHPDSSVVGLGPLPRLSPPSRARDTLSRPAFKSDAGRVVFGGGGIRPDIVVPDDTLSTPEQEFLRAIAPKSQIVYTVLGDYALELKGSVARDFTAPTAWGEEAMSRLAKRGVAVDGQHTEVGMKLLTADLERRVARQRFGEAAAKLRGLADDHQLMKAIELLKHSTTQTQLFAAVPASSGAPLRK